MDIELLKTFVEVSRTRHFARAAEDLYLTQSAISSRIRQLENQLGATLFTRHRNNINLTTSGKKFLSYAEELITIWQNALNDMQQKEETRISIGAPPVLWETSLTTWLKMLYPHHVDLQIETKIATRSTLIKQLLSRELDLLITLEPTKMERLTSQAVGQLSLILCSAAKNDTQAVKPYLKLDLELGLNPQETELMAGNRSPLLQSTSAQMVRELLKVTKGCAFLPEQWSKEQRDLAPIPEAPVIVYPLYAVWLENSEKSTLINQLIQIPIN